MNTLFDKIWDKHVVQIIEGGPTQLYIDRLYMHEVTSPQAFAGMRERGLKCFRPKQIFCMPDHNTPTHDQDKPIEDPVSKKQVDTLAKNCEDFGLTHYAMNTPDNGIIHVVGEIDFQRMRDSWFQDIERSVDGRRMGAIGQEFASTHGCAHLCRRYTWLVGL